MALTVATITKPEVLASGLKVATYSVAFDSSYPTGGEAWDLSDDFSYVTGLSANCSKDADNVTHYPHFIGGTLVSGKGYAAATMALATVITGAETANTTDLSGIDEIIVTVFGV